MGYVVINAYDTPMEIAGALFCAKIVAPSTFGDRVRRAFAPEDLKRVGEYLIKYADEECRNRKKD